MSHTHRYNNNIHIFSKNGSKRACLKFLVTRVDDAHKTNHSVLNGDIWSETDMFDEIFINKTDKKFMRGVITELVSGKGVKIFRWVV